MPDTRSSLVKNLITGLIIGIVLGSIGGYFAGKHIAELECVSSINKVANMCGDLVDDAQQKTGLDEQSKIRSDCAKNTVSVVSTGSKLKGTQSQQIEQLNVLYRTCLVGKGMKPEDLY